MKTCYVMYLFSNALPMWKSWESNVLAKDVYSLPPKSPVNLSSKIQINNYLELFICILEIWLLKWIFEWLLEKYFKMTAVQHSDVVINTVGSQQGVGLNTLAEGFHICVVSLHFLPWCKDLPGLGYGNNNNSVKTNYSCQAGGTAVSDLRPERNFRVAFVCSLCHIYCQFNM